MIMKKIALILTVFFGFVSTAQAYEPSTPLMVVRFNKTNVAYENSLYKAVSAAVRKKEDVIFTVVSRSNRGGYKANEIASAIEQIGVNKAQIRVNYELAVGKTDEVYVYIK